jgi:hypothetical protein
MGIEGISWSDGGFRRGIGLVSAMGAMGHVTPGQMGTAGSGKGSAVGGMVV